MVRAMSGNLLLSSMEAPRKDAECTQKLRRIVTVSAEFLPNYIALSLEDQLPGQGWQAEARDALGALWFLKEDSTEKDL